MGNTLSHAHWNEQSDKSTCHAHTSGGCAHVGCSRHLYVREGPTAELEKANHCKSAEKHFPGAVPQSIILKLALKCIKDQGCDESSLLFATSCCPDEINRDLDDEAKDLGRAFCMGGLAGFPFVGRTGFGAFMHHVPAGGCMLIICASHVGIDEHGVVGKVHRLGMESDTTACGAAIAAYNYCAAHREDLARIAAGDPAAYAGFDDPLDPQQNYIQRYVASIFEEVSAADHPMAALAYACARKIRKDLDGIIPSEVKFPLFILSGIQINFEGDNVGEDYFCPLGLTVRKGGADCDMLPPPQAKPPPSMLQPSPPAAAYCRSVQG